jgi:hypothetical protein
MTEASLSKISKRLMFDLNPASGPPLSGSFVCHLAYIDYDTHTILGDAPSGEGISGDNGSCCP